MRARAAAAAHQLAARAVLRCCRALTVVAHHRRQPLAEHASPSSNFFQFFFNTLTTTAPVCLSANVPARRYTTIGAIFSDFVGSVSFGIIIVIGVLTLCYTAYGGLAVSIATDQVQGVASMLLAVLLTIYVAVTYRCVRWRVRCSGPQARRRA